MRVFWTGFMAGTIAALAASAAAWVSGPGRPARLLGHLRYHTAPASDLRVVDSAGKVRLRRNAATALRGMQDAAAREGILLVPVSGYRDYRQQQRLYFETAAEHGQTLRERAALCAPPGYSEHHTGYSVDLGDAAHVETQLERRFVETPAFRWLQRHAARHHFELSFSEGNSAGVAYEPWHWRYVGDLGSFRTFYRARLEPPWR